MSRSPSQSPIFSRRSEDEDFFFLEDDDEPRYTEDDEEGPSPFDGSGGGNVFFDFATTPAPETFPRDVYEWATPMRIFPDDASTPSPVVPDSEFFTPSPRTTGGTVPGTPMMNPPLSKSPEQRRFSSLTPKELEMRRLEKQGEIEKERDREEAQRKFFTDKEGGEIFLRNLPEKFHQDLPPSPRKKEDPNEKPAVDVIIPPMDTEYGGGDFVINIQTRGIDPEVTGSYFIEITPSIFKEGKNIRNVPMGMVRGVIMRMQSKGLYSNQFLVTVPRESVKIILRITPGIDRWIIEKPLYGVRPDQVSADPELRGAPRFDLVVRLGNAYGRVLKRYDINWEIKQAECKVCGETTRRRCKGCKKVWYCGKKCQISDWKNMHKKECFFK